MLKLAVSCIREITSDWTQEYCFGQKILPEDDEPTRRLKAEEQARRLTPHFKWLDDGSLEVIQDVPAFRRINPGGIPTWFNGLAGKLSMLPPITEPQG